ncbi:AGE family epimerase/isomerase [Marinomonas sp. TW1]|uniref:AGE family epimerase/isomerase n=1 Tax=Marinomonas sp. TW1 TaxID=1561203 RepID=UPI0007AFBCD2|nr:AGE family epimerase/isomerase [Marinomonas sp. TW1]KZN12961.1 phosphoheptose isomerase [Marinomonas sp. TW1]
MLESAILDCQSFVFNKLLPQWAKHGLNQKQGYSYESLNLDWSINAIGRVRLLTQCRQLYTLSHASLLQEDKALQSKLKPLFDFIISQYFIDGRWIFSLNDDLSPQKTESDTYALAFVMLSFSSYYQCSQDNQALDYIEKTHHFLNHDMLANNGGFYESYPLDISQTRRQNPHMHLLEGYIAAFKVTQKEAYKQTIQSLLTLALTHFYDEKTKTLREFFHHDWQLHSEKGSQIEPGHHFEWVWLLFQANQIIPHSDHTDLAQSLWITATRHGMANNGGIYNQIDAETYQPLDREKRIWPITEYIKAITVMPIGLEEKKHRLDAALSFMLQHYLLDDGGWNEYLDKDNIPKDYPLPGTSSYHIFLGLIEVLRWSEAQGIVKNAP